MNSMSRIVGARAILTLLMAVLVGLCLVPRASAHDHGDIKRVQDTLHDKGFYKGPVDGIMGHQTRAAIREYQESEKLPVTGHLDAETSEKLGVGPESVGGDFKDAGKHVGTGGEAAGHEMKEGKPVAAGKELGVGIGKGGKDVGKGVKKAVSTKSDGADPEKK
jgi:peptidoglycan hydrolase-like protein with peptidoglycan-binding domain